MEKGALNILQVLVYTYGGFDDKRSMGGWRFRDVIPERSIRLVKYSIWQKPTSFKVFFAIRLIDFNYFGRPTSIESDQH